MHAYPKIKDLEMMLILLKLPEVVVTEKIHGMNFRVFIPAGMRTIDDVEFGGKGTIITQKSPYAPLVREIKEKGLLDPLVERIKGMERSEEGSERSSEKSWTLFGELYGPAIEKAIPYRKEGVDVRFFDMMEGNDLLPYDHFIQKAEAWNLPRVPELYRGPPDMNLFNHLAYEPSSLGSGSLSSSGSYSSSSSSSIPSIPREGIIIRNPSLQLIDGQLPIAKFKPEQFREKDYSFSVEDFQSMANEEEKVRIFTCNFVTEVRVRKIMGRAQEANLLSYSAKDMPHLIQLTLEDIQEEDKTYYDTLQQEMAQRLIAQKVNQVYTTILRREREFPLL